MSTPEKLPPFRAGDAIRGVGSILVVLAHIAYYAFLFNTGPEELGGQAGFDARYGPLGGFFIDAGLFALWTFFALSGYLIARPFVVAIAARERLPRLGSYVRNRLLRIVPAFWVIFGLLLLRFGAGESSLGDVMWVLGFQQTTHGSEAAELIPQAWSLDVEFAFYVAIPIVAFVGALVLRAPRDRVRRAAILLAILAGLWALSVALRTWDTDSFADRTALPAIAFAFLPGVALAALEAGGAPVWVRARAVLARRVALGLVIAGLACLAIYAAGAGEPLGKRAVLISAGAGALLAAPMLNQWAGRPRWRLLENRPLSWVGERSFSLYLLHIWVIFEIETRVTEGIDSVRADSLALLALALPISLLAAHVSYELIEKPALRLKRRRRQRPPGARAGTPA